MNAKSLIWIMNGVEKVNNPSPKSNGFLPMTNERSEFMNLKIKGLNINIDENKNVGFLLNNDALKEFCDYHKIDYEDKDIYTNGAASKKKSLIYQKMALICSEILTNNNWRKMHHLPLIRRRWNKK